MRRHILPVGPVSVEAKVSVFAGLGHVLEDVRRVAAMLAPRPLRRPGESLRPRVSARAARPLSGYGLLLSLGREIRGR